MVELLKGIDRFFEFLGPITDMLWEFPRNFEWYAGIPLIGELSLAIWVLVGGGLYFSIKLGFVQIRYFRRTVQILLRKNEDKTGLSPWAAFLLSSAVRVGPGNIMGVTGAIMAGGPGALFWMWFSAFFGMCTGFVEATLSQIFKEKKEDAYVGGIAYYGRRLLGNYKAVGFFLAIAYITYALFTLVGQVFHTFNGFGGMVSEITGVTYEGFDTVNLVIGLGIIALVTPIVFGGLRRISKVTNIMIPFMAIVYVVVALVLILINFDKIPFFFSAVVTEAFKPQAIFGGALGIALQQGIKRGLMSNEAGQGTITMAAASSNAKHPVEQGFVQSMGVFLDTFILSTITGFLVVMAQIWNVEGVDIVELSRLESFTTSLGVLTPAFLGNSVEILMSFCYGLFAFSSFLGMIAFIDICANEISRSKYFLFFVKVIAALVFIPFGILCKWNNLDLDNIWMIADFTNVMMVLINVPLLFIGIRIVKKTLVHYEKDNEAKFDGSVIGMELEYWDNKDKE